VNQEKLSIKVTKYHLPPSEGEKGAPQKSEWMSAKRASARRVADFGIAVRECLPSK